MKPISPYYERIINDFYKEKAKKRFRAIYKYSDLFLDEYVDRKKFICGVDVIKMETFIESYFLDVARFKEYHFPPKNSSDLKAESVHKQKHLNSSKVGAFTVKWLCKNHPVYIVLREGVHLSKEERSRAAIGPYILIVNITLRVMGVSISDVPSELYKKLIYHLRFRSVDDRSIMLFFDALGLALSAKARD